jgi:hypothetical protein
MQSRGDRRENLLLCILRKRLNAGPVLAQTIPPRLYSKWLRLAFSTSRWNYSGRARSSRVPLWRNLALAARQWAGLQRYMEQSRRDRDEGIVQDRALVLPGSGRYSLK